MNDNCLIAIDTKNCIRSALATRFTVKSDWDNEFITFLEESWQQGYAIKLVSLTDHVVTIGIPLIEK